MFRTNSNARVAWVGDLKVEQKKNNSTGETYESKSILFRVATNRNYSVTKKDANGNVLKDGQGNSIKERPSDFLLCKATGQLAETISKYCSLKREDGSLISRRLELIGHIETYQGTKIVEITKPVNINGVVYNIEFKEKFNFDSSILVVNEMEFLDSKPEEAVTATPAVSTGVTVTVAPQGIAPTEGVIAPATVPVATPPVPVPGQQPVAQAPVQPAVQTIVVPPALAETAGGVDEDCPF